ncbi:unnamed protein product [Pseudo-nitzschia multistriata]|uniref:Uncharacterized protein n=1 Tax=Pseudo-nitzschia multistriata TaxID=183589 RepID=A0A448ZQZ4_9STRA|nr:unnamed protein product [Pseudo-nitzschia multistriata]
MRTSFATSGAHQCTNYNEESNGAPLIRSASSVTTPLRMSRPVFPIPLAQSQSTQRVSQAYRPSPSPTIPRYLFDGSIDCSFDDNATDIVCGHTEKKTTADIIDKVFAILESPM